MRIEHKEIILLTIFHNMACFLRSIKKMEKASAQQDVDGHQEILLSNEVEMLSKTRNSQFIESIYHSKENSNRGWGILVNF